MPRLLMQVRRELILMKERDDYVPTYGRFLLDAEPDDPALWKQLMEVQYQRQRAVARRHR